MGNAGRNTMTFSEYRASFNTVEEFEEVFSSLPFEQARELATTAEGSAMVKACIMSRWRIGSKCIED